MNRTLKVRIKNVYGIKTVYPVCDDSRTLCSIAGTKTLTRNTIDAAKKLGYTIEVQAETL